MDTSLLPVEVQESVEPPKPLESVPVLKTLQTAIEGWIVGVIQIVEDARRHFTRKYRSLKTSITKANRQLTVFSKRSFKAYNSWDYVTVAPMIDTILQKAGNPATVSDTEIEDKLMQAGVPGMIKRARLRHCISRTLSEMGYEKRSRRGHGWDLVL